MDKNLLLVARFARCLKLKLFTEGFHRQSRWFPLINKKKVDKFLGEICQLILVGLDGFEPSECHSQSVVPYHLATAQYKEKRLINEVFFLGGVGSGIRTHDLQCHKLTR